MANRAFCVLSDVIDNSGQAQVIGTGFVVDANGAIVTSGLGVGTFIDSSDTANTIHERIADNIRDGVGDPSLVVIFTDSPGRY